MELNIMKYNRIKKIPIKLVLIYLLATLFLFEFGPFNWQVENKYIFYSLQFLYLLFFALGYTRGINTKSNKFEWTEQNDQWLISLLKVILMINFFVFIINLFREFGLNSLNFGLLFKNISEGFLDVGVGYANRLKRIESITAGNILGGRVFTIFNYFWFFFSFSSILLGLLYFKKLPFFFKIIVLSLSSLTVVFYVSIGTNIGVFRIIFAMAIFYMISKLRDYLNDKISLRKQFNKIFIGLLLFIGVTIIYFTITMRGRGGILLWNTQYYNIGGVTLDYDSFMIKYLPIWLIIPVISLSSYLTQGYYAFGLALKLDWIPMFGLGSSMELIDTLTKYGINIDKFTYQYRLQENFDWNSRVQWASMYTWFANDFSFIGVIVIMFIIGYFWALSFKDSITTENPFAKIIFYFLSFLIIFIPANNQIIQDFYTLLPLVICSIAWLQSRNGRPWKIVK